MTEIPADKAGPRPLGTRAASADGAGRNPRGDEWLTPEAIIRALGWFDLDPACPMPGTAPNLQWVTAERCYTPADNGLLQRWIGRVLLNPPYSNGLISPFMARMAEHDNGIAIVNAKTDAVWFAKHIWERAAAVLFVYRRIRFIPAAGPIKGHDARKASAIIAYGTRNVDALADSGIPGALVPLPGGRQVIAVYRPDSSVTWDELLTQLARRQGGRLKVQLAYILVKHHPKAAANPNYDAKVRQILQGPSFRRVAPATYELRASA